MALILCGPSSPRVDVFVPDCVTVYLCLSLCLLPVSLFPSFLLLPPPILLAAPVINRQNGNSPSPFPLLCYCTPPF